MLITIIWEARVQQHLFSCSSFRTCSKWAEFIPLEGEKDGEKPLPSLPFASVQVAPRTGYAKSSDSEENYAHPRTWLNVNQVRLTGG